MKRLYRSRRNKMFLGVCGGIAEYFDVDPVLVRLIFVIFFFVGGSAILAYILGWLIIPQRPLDEEEVPESTEGKSVAKAVDKDASKPAAPAPVSSGSLVFGIILVVLGGIFLLHNIPIFRWNFWWWFDRYFWKFVIPGMIIVVGTLLIMKGSEKK